MKTAGPLLGLLLAVTAVPTIAQSQTPSNSPDSSQPATTEKAPSATIQSKKPDTAQKPKKVWTNDDVGSLKGSVSTVGGKNKPQSQAEYGSDADEGEDDPHARRVQQYRDAIEQLRTQIEDADTRIAQLKNFKAENGSPSGGINPNHGYNTVPLEEQVKQLEVRKKELQAKIEDLENQARKEGIDPGELR